MTSSSFPTTRTDELAFSLASACLLLSVTVNLESNMSAGLGGVTGTGGDQPDRHLADSPGPTLRGTVRGPVGLEGNELDSVLDGMRERGLLVAEHLPQTRVAIGERPADALPGLPQEDESFVAVAPVVLRVVPGGFAKLDHGGAVTSRPQLA